MGLQADRPPELLEELDTLGGIMRTYSHQISARIRREAHQEACERIARALPLLEVAHAVSTGCTCHECQAGDVDRPEPASVPEILETTGGHAVIVRDRVTSSTPWADVWGDAR